MRSHHHEHRHGRRRTHVDTELDQLASEHRSRHHHPHGVLHSGWHFLERMYDRMQWHAGHRGHRDGARHGGGWGGWGNGMGDGDNDGFTRGRKFSSNDLQLLLIATLSEKPAHGYELIKALEMLSNGYYTPSPGMVYPALTYLEELSYLVVTKEGTRKRYELSDAGREYLEQNKDRVEAMLNRLAHIGAKMDSMRRAYSGESGAEWGEEGGWIPELMNAKYQLKNAMFQRNNLTREQQKLIAAILARAAQDISEV